MAEERSSETSEQTCLLTMCNNMEHANCGSRKTYSAWAHLIQS